MQAVIIAGGEGTRIKSIFPATPKLLLPLNGETLLDYLINYLKKNDCKDIIICSGYLGSKIKEYVERRNFGIKMRLSQEEKLLGTAGALRLVKNLLSETFLVLFGDIFTTIDIGKLLKFHLENSADGTVVVRETEHPDDSNLVSFNKDLSVKKFYFKPHKGITPSKYGLTAIYLFNQKILDLLPETTPMDLERDFLPFLLKYKKKLVCYNTDEFISDIGTPERYNKSLKLFKK